MNERTITPELVDAAIDEVLSLPPEPMPEQLRQRLQVAAAEFVAERQAEQGSGWVGRSRPRPPRND